MFGHCPKSFYSTKTDILEKTIMKCLPQYLHDPFSSLSHALGAVLSVVGLVLLLSWSGNDPWRLTSFAIYGSTLILQYVASALYHGLRRYPGLGDALYSLDRSAIYALIAGTYTPICLIAIGGAWGWSLFGVVWGLAVTGIVLDIILKRQTPALASSGALSGDGLALYYWYCSFGTLPDASHARLACTGFFDLYGRGSFVREVSDAAPRPFSLS